MTADVPTPGGWDAAIALRPVRPGDEPFLYEVYTSTRQEELAPVPWDVAQKTALLRMRFAPARALPGAFRRRGVRHHPRPPAGRLYVKRATDELRIVDIACCPSTATAASGRAC